MKSVFLKQVVFVLAFATVIISPNSHATCEQEDMAGLWQFFLEATWSDNPAFTIFVEVSETGEVIGGSYKLSEFLRGQFDSGNIIVKNNCRIKGSFGGSYDEDPHSLLLSVSIIDSRTVPDTQYWAGYLRYEGADMSFGTRSFTAIRVR